MARKSLDEIEQQFVEELALERHRRRSLMRTARRRSLEREVERRHKLGSVRFVLLVLTLILTAVVVTAVMFRVLYILLS